MYGNILKNRLRKENRYRNILLNCINHGIYVWIIEPFFCCLNYIAIPHLYSLTLLMHNKHDEELAKVQMINKVKLSLHGEELLFLYTSGHQLCCLPCLMQNSHVKAAIRRQNIVLWYWNYEILLCQIQLVSFSGFGPDLMDVSHKMRKEEKCFRKVIWIWSAKKASYQEKSNGKI